MPQRKTVDATEIGAVLVNLRGLSRRATEVPDGLVPIAKAAERTKAGSGEIMQLIFAGFLKALVRREEIAGCAGLFPVSAEVRSGTFTGLPDLSPMRAPGGCSGFRCTSYVCRKYDNIYKGVHP